MEKHPIEQLTAWIVRDASRRTDFRHYDMSEVAYLCRRYLERPDLLAQAPRELIVAADRHVCGLIRHGAVTFAKRSQRAAAPMRAAIRDARHAVAAE
jgi:hypothetical protein